MKDRLGDKLRVQHMLKAIEEIGDYTQGIGLEAFANSSLILNATIRQLEVLGEAANHLSPELLAAYPAVEWPKIIALRNLLIHQYFGVMPKLIWQIVQQDLPILQQHLFTILSELP